MSRKLTKLDFEERKIRGNNEGTKWTSHFFGPDLRITSEHFEFQTMIVDRNGTVIGIVKPDHPKNTFIGQNGGIGWGLHSYSKYKNQGSRKIYTGGNMGELDSELPYYRSDDKVKFIVNKKEKKIWVKKNNEGEKFLLYENIDFPEELCICVSMSQKTYIVLTGFQDLSSENQRGKVSITYDNGRDEGEISGTVGEPDGKLVSSEPSLKDNEKKDLQNEEPVIRSTPPPESKEEEEEEEEDELFTFLKNNRLSGWYEKLKSGDVKYDDLEIFLEEPESLEDFIPTKFHRIKFLKALKKEKEKKDKQTDVLAGEYDWDGKSVQVKENFAYFENNRYEFEKLTGNVYKIDIKGDIYVFIWDSEDEMLRVVKAKGEYEFIKRISEAANSFSSDVLSGEYDWNGKSLDLKKNHCYFERKRYSFEKVASSVYTVQMNEKKFVFNWDKEDTVLGVVRVEGDRFFERIEKKVYMKKIKN